MTCLHTIYCCVLKVDIFAAHRTPAPGGRHRQLCGSAAAPHARHRRTATVSGTDDKQSIKNSSRDSAVKSRPGFKYPGTQHRRSFRENTALEPSSAGAEGESHWVEHAVGCNCANWNCLIPNSSILASWVSIASVERGEESGCTFILHICAEGPARRRPHIEHLE